jgi:hypothetical protein
MSHDGPSEATMRALRHLRDAQAQGLEPMIGAGPRAIRRYGADEYSVSVGGKTFRSAQSMLVFGHPYGFPEPVTDYIRDHLHRVNALLAWLSATRIRWARVAAMRITSSWGAQSNDPLADIAERMHAG